MSCPPIDSFRRLLQGIDQAAEIDKDKENALRYNVWSTTSTHIEKMVNNLNTDELPDNNSVSITDKLKRTFKRIANNDNKAESFISDVINDKDNIQMSIALYELMESVKGEADNTRKYDIPVNSVLNDGVLPSTLLARIAASIGRKIMYQQGFRIANSAEVRVEPAEVERMYYSAGIAALQKLENKGYVKIGKGNAIKNYISSEEKNKPLPDTNRLSSDEQIVSLNTDKLNIAPNSQEAAYFLDRQKADISDTNLSAITNILSAVRQVTQPSKYQVPDSSPSMSDNDYKDVDAYGIALDEKSEKVRKQLYKHPLKVHSSVHDFMNLLHKEVLDSGLPASKILKDLFKDRPGLLRSLFGLKDTTAFSVDKLESVSGQNLSKTTAIDDIAEYYDLLMDGGKPANLHMPLKVGRNQRLYYLNSVLNAHASKQSRYMITAGTQTISTKSEDFKYLVHQVASTLDPNLTYKDILEGTNENLEDALKIFETFNNSVDLKSKIYALSRLPKLYNNLDYVTLSTALQAINDIRNPVKGDIKTEFAVSADATASGGTLTFFQALATNPNIKTFLESLGMFPNKDGNIVASNSDIYSLMSDAINKFITPNNSESMASDLGVNEDGVKQIFQDTLNLLFDESNGSREFSKSPTMTFVYQQGKNGAISTITSDLADRIMDTLDSPDTKMYLSKLFKDSAFIEMDPADLKSIEGLYVDIRKALIESKLPSQLYDLLGTAIKDKYLAEYQQRSSDIFNLVKKTLGNKVIKILPAGAVLDGKVASKDLNNYGMPIAKVFEIMNKLSDGTEVLTREQLLHKTIMDVSTIHGIDSALLYHAIDDANLKEGVVVVHDEIRGSVASVRAVQKAYINKAQEVLSNYDIHEQMLEALKVYHPEIVDNAEFQKIEKDVKKTLEEKKKLSKDFNTDTSALIGEGNAHNDFAKGGNTSTSKSETTFKETLKTLAKDSPLITTFLNAFNTKVEESEEFSYIPSLDKLTVNFEGMDKNNSIEALEHEIIHAATIADIKKALDGTGSKVAIRDIKYFQKTLQELTKLDHKLSEDAKDRLGYILSQPTEEQRIGEFVAIMLSEKDIATEMYKAVDETRLLYKIRKFVERVKQHIAELTDSDFNENVDSIRLYGALQRTLNRGISDRVQNQEETLEVLKSVKNSFGYGKNTQKVNTDFLNRAVSKLLMRKAEEQGKGLLGSANFLLSSFPAYTAVTDKIRKVYDSSEDLQQLLHTITGEGVDKKKKAKVLAEYAKTTAQRNSFISENLKDFDEITKPFTKEDKAVLDNLIFKVPLYDYFVQAGDINTSEKLEQSINALRAELSQHPKALKDVKSLLDLNEDIISGDIYNLENYSSDSEFHLKVRKLLALESLNKIGSEKVFKLLKNTKLRDKLEDLTLANYLSTLEIGGKKDLRASTIPQSYSEGVQQRAITLKQLPQYEYGENTGWVVLEKPTKTSLGLVYRKVVDSTSIPGAFTDVKMSSSDLSVPLEMSKYKNVMKTTSGHKLIVKREHREAMGSLGAVDSLVRSTAHSMSIQESEIIRNELLKEETTFTVDLTNKDALDDILKDKDQDNPWFLKSDGMSYSDLSNEAKARYKPVGSRVSNVKGFDDKVTWVRKDISHWLLGGDRNSPFENPKWKWGLRIVKDLVSMAKIGMVVLNPGKIARDNLSNITYLGVMGVDPLFAHKSYTSILKEFGDYSETKTELIQLKVKLAAKPDNEALKKRYKTLNDKLKRNPISSIEDKGFLNSLGSALISRDSETLGNVERDVNKALTFLLKNTKGKNNYISHFIMQMQKIGFKGEDFLGYLAGKAGKFKTTKELESELLKVEERLKTIRSDEDVVAYVSQFINSPQSEAVKFGANITDLVDVLAKETYYRHLVDQGMKPEEAKIKVLDSFPNYIENMPLAVQQASDAGIVMFPSFWLRIQKVIYRMVRDRPVSLATEEAIDSYLNIHIENIVDSNIVNKATSWGGILHSPFESAGLSGIFPTNALNL